MKLRSYILFLLLLCGFSLDAKVFVPISQLSDLQVGDSVAITIQNGRNIYSWYALTNSATQKNTQPISVKDNILRSPIPSVVWYLSSVTPYSFEQSGGIYPMSNSLAWTLISYIGTNRFSFCKADTSADTLIWRANKSGHYIDWFSKKKGDKFIFDQVDNAMNLSTGAAAFNVFKQMPAAWFDAREFGRLDSRDTLLVPSFGSYKLTLPSCYEASARHPFLGWTTVAGSNNVVGVPGDVVIIDDDIHYYAVFDTVVVPTQCFDFTDLYADYVTCRWGTIARYPTQYVFNPDSLTEVGVMTGTNLSSYDVHINVISDPNSTCALLKDSIREIPSGFSKSIRLGNYQKGVNMVKSYCEDVEYTIMVDTTEAPIMLIKYLPVLEDSHQGGSGLRFDIYDEHGSKIDSACASFNFSLEDSTITGAMPGAPVWKKSLQNPNYPLPTTSDPEAGYNGGPYRYHDWATLGLDLTPYHGQTIVLKLILNDCLWSGHLGFCYFAIKCQKRKIDVYTCGAGDDIQMVAPEGFFYRWYSKSKPDEYFSTSRITAPPVGYTDSVFFCDMSVKSDFSCAFTVSVNVKPRYPVARIGYELRRGFCADTLYVENLSFASPDRRHEFSPHEDCDKALWDFGGGTYLNGAQPNPNIYFPYEPVIYNKPGDYTVSLKTCLNDWSCAMDEDHISFHVAASESYQVIYDTICLGDFFVFRGDTLRPTRAGDHTYIDHGKDVGCLSDVTVEERLHVRGKYYYEEYDTLCPNSVYEWHGQKITIPGVYYDSLSTRLGGCDSVHVLYLSIYPEKQDSTIFKEVICENNAYWWNGQRYDRTGLYSQTLQNEYGCDSVVTLDLYVRPAYGLQYPSPDYWEEPYKLENSDPYSWQDPYIRDTIEDDISDPSSWQDPYPAYPVERDTICENDVFYWHGKPYTQEGLHTDTLYTIYGCDSILYLHLTVWPEYEFYEQHVIWEGETYIWKDHHDDIALTKPGTYYDSLLTVHQCDSVYILDLIVNTIDHVTFIDTVCELEGKQWTLDGKDTVLRSTGVWNDTVMGSYGADSVTTLILTVFPTTYGDTVPLHVCYGDSLLWQGEYYFLEGVYSDTLFAQNTFGCDSLIFMSLSIQMPDTALTIDTICEGQTYTWAGNNYNVTSIDTVYLSNIFSCDSVCILNLFMQPAVHTYDTVEICQGDSLFFFGSYLKLSGDYEKRLTSLRTFCDSLIHLNLIVHPLFDTIIYDTICAGDTLYWEGAPHYRQGHYTVVYQDIYGCDSIRRLSLHIARRYWAEFDLLSEFWEAPYSSIDSFRTDPSSWQDPYPALEDTTDYYWDGLYWKTFFTEDTVCAGIPYIFHTHTYTESGFYIDTLQSSEHCDSLLYLRLTVLPPADTVTVDSVICEGDTITWHTYHDSLVYVVGDYYDTLRTISTPICDSVIYSLHLTSEGCCPPVPDSTIMHHAVYVKELPYVWQTHTLSSDTIVTDRFTNVQGCDSLSTFRLHVLDACEIPVLFIPSAPRRKP